MSRPLALLKQKATSARGTWSADRKQACMFASRIIRSLVSDDLAPQNFAESEGSVLADRISLVEHDLGESL